MEKTLLKVEVELEITDEDIDDIMSAALDGGITYWCYRAEVVEDEYFGEYASEQISRGGSLNLYDSEEDEVHLLTKENFMEGLKQFIASGRVGILEKKMSGKLGIDVLLLDADDADCIIQYALFNDVIYG